MEEKPWFDPGQLQSFFRHVYTALGTLTAVLLYLGISQADLSSISESLQKIGDGVVMIATGVSTLVPIIMGVWAAKSASVKEKLKVLNANPEIKKIETVPGTEAAKAAAEIPGTKVV